MRFLPQYASSRARATCSAAVVRAVGFVRFARGSRWGSFVPAATGYGGGVCCAAAKLAESLRRELRRSPYPAKSFTQFFSGFVLLHARGRSRKFVGDRACACNAPSREPQLAKSPAAREACAKRRLGTADKAARTSALRANFIPLAAALPPFFGGVNHVRAA